MPAPTDPESRRERASSSPDASVPRRQKRSNRDLLAALVSGLVGALALGSSVYNVYLQRQQVRAAVWPRLSGREEYRDDDYKTFIVNRGVGPAIIQRVRMSVDGNPARSWGDLMNTFPKDLTDKLPRGATLRVWNPQGLLGTLNPTGEDQLIELNDAALLLFMEAGNRMKAEVCYCSSLDDCWNWTFDFAGAEDTVPVRACNTDATPFRVQTAAERTVTLESLRDAISARAKAGARDGGADGGDAAAP